MKLSEMIQVAYAEDMPHGDLTTESLALTDRPGDARLVAKEDLVMSGMEVFEQCLKHVVPKAQLQWQFKDGDFILANQNVCWIKADLVQLLKAERVALNFLGHLSGIATLTRCFVQEVQDTSCKILDTRKTTPLMRALEKQAVRNGGGTNHRMDLSSAILIKENHIRAVGDLQQAIKEVRRKSLAAIEVECATLQEVEWAVSCKVNRILLDNMTDDQIRVARAKIPATIEIEASGNMKLERVGPVARLGVDFISVGALTHSAPCADFSMLFEWQQTR